MSNFKKFLALALAAMMVVGMMVFAPAASAYEPTGEYKDSIALLNAFDVMLGDGVSFGEKEEVTRWQMALLIARIVTGETGNAMWEGEKSDYFTDVTAEHFPGAIDFCAELGIIKGVGDNKYDPEAPIIYQDALTMIVRLLGYETETTTYPWGYILESRNIYYSVDDNPEHDVYLGAKINTGYKTNLLREEVAELLAVMIYVPVLNAAGKPGANLITSGLKCEDLGTYTLVATNTAATIGLTKVEEGATLGTGEISKLPAYGKVTFVKYDTEKKAIDKVEVSVANVTKGDLDLNNYLGFTAKLARVKKTIVAKMDSVTVYDAGKFKLDGAKIKIGKTSYATTVYGASETSVFVDATADDLSLNGRVYLCGKAARFVPYKTVKAVYPIDVAVKKAKGWPADATLKLYYVAASGYQAAVKDVVASIAANAQGKYVQGKVLAPNKVSNGTGAKDSTTARTALDDFSFRASTSLCTAVDGSIIWGEPFLGNITTVGNASFITVVEHPDIVTGTAKFNGTGDKVVKLGDTEFSVGYAAAGSPVNGWYYSFADIEQGDIENFFNSDVDYTTVGGYLVSMKKHDGTTTPTDRKPDEYTKTPLVLVINEDGANVTVNDDDTLTVAALNLATGAVESVKIDQVNGTRIGRLINLFGLQLFDAENAGEALLRVLRSNDTVHTNLKNGSKAAYSILATVANKTGDVYSVSSTVDKYTQVRLKGEAAELTFKKYATSAISTSTYTQVIYDAANSTTTEAKYKDAAAKYLTVTADTEILVIAADQMGTIKGAVPADGSFLKLYTDEASQFVFELSNNRIVIYNADKNFAEITNITKSAAPVVVEGGWYTLTWTTTYVGMQIVKDGDTTYYNYTFDNMYNLTTKKNETVVISAKAYYADPAESFFGACWTDGKKTPLTSKDDAKAMFVAGQAAPFYRPYYISNELGSGAQVSSMISWGLANGYLVGRIDKTTYGDPNTLAIKNLTVTEGDGSYTLTVNPATDKDIDVVVNYSMFVMNQSKDSGADEFHIVGVTSTNKGYNNKAKNNTLFVSAGEKEIVLYKLDEKTGTAEVIVNFVDALGASNIGKDISDACASAKG